MKIKPVSFDSGILKVLRLGIVMEILITAAGFAAKILQQDGDDLPIWGLAILLLVQFIMVVKTNQIKTLKNLPFYVLPLLLTGTTVTGIALPWLIIQPLNIQALLTTQWLMIPAILIPLLVLSLSYRYWGVFLFVIGTNLINMIFYVFSEGFIPVADFEQPSLMIGSFVIRIFLMISLGHLLVFFVGIARQNHQILMEQHHQIALMNGQLEKSIEERTLAMNMVNQMTLLGWVKLLELRDFETEGHCARVADLAARLAVHMGCSMQFVDYVQTGALLHDIGKLGIPDEILLKPGILTCEEKAIMQRHILHGYGVLKEVSFLEPCLDLVLHHHERWDGSGYPHGLQGEAIPFAARLFSIVDVWDALTSHRPYRSAWTQEEARIYIIDQAGHQFDPLVVDAYLELLELLPQKQYENLDRLQVSELVLLTIAQASAGN